MLTKEEINTRASEIAHSVRLKCNDEMLKEVVKKLQMN